MHCDTGTGGDHYAHGFRSTASVLLNKEGRVDGDVVEVQLARGTEKNVRRRERVGRALAR